MPNKITKTSKNTNCLEGMKCPKCGQDDSLKIEATCIFTVTDDGTEDEGNGHEWGDTNYCECPDCGHHGTVADFTIEEWSKEKEAVVPTPERGSWTLEIQYQSAERKAKTGYLALYDESGEYIGRVAGTPRIVEAFLKSGLVSKITKEG
jgi:Zn ribbon nucleic-acid-binding protein